MKTIKKHTHKDRADAFREITLMIERMFRDNLMSPFSKNSKRYMIASDSPCPTTTSTPDNLIHPLRRMQ